MTTKLNCSPSKSRTSVERASGQVNSATENIISLKENVSTVAVTVLNNEIASKFSEKMGVSASDEKRGGTETQRI
jgi:hypothetical protein